MPKYLNHLDLNGNQLKNAKLEITDSPLAEEGVIHYHDTNNTVRFYNGSSWQTLGTATGDITGVTAGNGLSGGGNSGAVTLTLDISDSSLTTATSIAQADLLAFSDEDASNDPTKNITFSNLEDTIFGNVSGNATIAAGGALSLADDSVDSAEIADGAIDTAHIADDQVTYAKMQDTGTNNRLLGAATAGTIGEVQVATAMVADDAITYAKIQNVSATNVVLGRDSTGAGVIEEIDASALRTIINVENGATADQTQSDINGLSITTVGTLSSGAIGSDFGNINIGSSNLTATGTISLGATSFNDNNITNVGDIALDTISSDGNTIGVTMTDNVDSAFVVKQGSDEYISIDTRDGSEIVDIGTGVSGTTINIGHGTSTVAIGDNLTVAGDLTVTGTTATVNQTNLDVSDNIIGLNRGASSNANDSGLIIERGSTGNNAAIIWDESADKFTMGTTTATPSSTGNLTITTGTLVANLQGAVTGNADTASALASAVNIGGVSFDGSGSINLPGVNTAGDQNTTGTAAVATAVTITDNENTNENNAIIFAAGGDLDGGNLGLESDGDLTYNPSTGRLTATQLAGTITTASQTNITAVGTIGTGTWQGTAIASGYIAGDAIDGSKIADDAVDSEHLVDGSVDNAHLANSSISINGVSISLGGSVTTANTQLDIASTTEAEAGSDDSKAMSAAKVADRTVVATIDVSNSTFTSNLYAEIQHGLGTADIIVQLYDINTEQTVEADVFRTDKAGSASTDKIKVVFSAAPAAANDIRVLITSCRGGQSGTVAYS